MAPVWSAIRKLSPGATAPRGSAGTWLRSRSGEVLPVQCAIRGVRNTLCGPARAIRQPSPCRAAPSYCATAIVTVLLVAPSIDTCTGRSSPAGALPGTMALICQTPTKPGASPLKRIRAGRPPMVAVGAPMVVDSGVAGAACPAGTDGVTTKPDGLLVEAGASIFRTDNGSVGSVPVIH